MTAPGATPDIGSIGFVAFPASVNETVASLAKIAGFTPSDQFTVVKSHTLLELPVQLRSAGLEVPGS